MGQARSGDQSCLSNRRAREHALGVQIICKDPSGNVTRSSSATDAFGTGTGAPSGFPSPLYDVAPAPGAAGTVGTAVPGAQDVVGGDHLADLTLHDGVDPAAVVRALVDAGVPVREATAVRTSLEDVFLRVYGEAASR